MPTIVIDSFKIIVKESATGLHSTFEENKFPVSLMYLVHAFTIFLICLTDNLSLGIRFQQCIKLGNITEIVFHLELRHSLFSWNIMRENIKDLWHYKRNEPEIYHLIKDIRFLKLSHKVPLAIYQHYQCKIIWVLISKLLGAWLLQYGV